MPTVGVHDVARYILEWFDSKGEQISTWKLQKLVYYCQAWSLVWDDNILFPEEIQAWTDGPVCPALYAMHRTKYMLTPDDISGDPTKFTMDQKETIDAILNDYGKRDGRYLSDLTHMERPWQEARKGLEPLERGSSIIDPNTMVV